MIVHQGTQLDTGHYYGYYRSTTGTWLHCNDTNIEELTMENFIERTEELFSGERSAYLLLYQQIGQDD